MSLTIFDLTGNRIKELFDRELPKDRHSVTIDVSSLSDDVFILQAKKESRDLSIRL